MYFFSYLNKKENKGVWQYKPCLPEALAAVAVPTPTTNMLEMLLL